MVFHADPGFIAFERFGHAAQSANFVSFDIHSNHIDFVDVFGFDESVEGLNGYVDDAFVIGARGDAADVRVFGDIERQGRVGVADGDIV